MVGMRDVAKAAGVSLSIFSLVVNNTGYVSADMRAKVESAMRQLNYIPNELARNLYRNRTNTIGVIMPTIAHPFFSTLTAHLQREFAARDLKTLLCSTADADKGEGEYVDMLQRHMMDGIIMAAHTEHPADYWTSIHRPIVAFDRTLGEGVPVVRSDHEQGGRLIARQLIDSGARHVVLVGGPRSQFAAATTFPTIRYHPHRRASAGRCRHCLRLRGSRRRGRHRRPRSHRMRHFRAVSRCRRHRRLRCGGIRGIAGSLTPGYRDAC